MDLSTLLFNSALAGLFASGIGVILTAPARYLAPAFLCGFTARFARDALMGWGLTQNWSTAVAAAVLVIVAVAIIRERAVPPVVLVSAVLPLGAAAAMFDAILEIMRVSSMQGEALGAAAVALTASMARVFITSLAIAVGFGVGLAIVRLFRREKVWAAA